MDRDGIEGCDDAQAIQVNIKTPLIRDGIKDRDRPFPFSGLPCEVALTQADGMPEDSFANCDVLLTVPKSRLIRRITLLGAAKMRDVNNALKFAMEIP